MHFRKVKGKQHIDCRGDFLLTRRDEFITTEVPSAGPKRVQFLQGVCKLQRYGFAGKMRATFATIEFIWGKNTALTKESIEARGI